MISALAEVKQVHEILSEYHEETYIFLEPGLRKVGTKIHVADTSTKGVNRNDVTNKSSKLF